MCYRNPCCGWEQWMGATFIVGRLVWAQILWVHCLIYCFWCRFLFFLDHISVSPQSSAWLVLLFSCRTPFWPITYVFSLLVYWQFSFQDDSQSPYLYRCSSLLIGLLPLHVPNLDSPLESTPCYIRCLSHYNISLVSSMQSSIISSPTSEGTAP